MSKKKDSTEEKLKVDKMKDTKAEKETSKKASKEDVAQEQDQVQNENPQTEEEIAGEIAEEIREVMGESSGQNKEDQELNAKYLRLAADFQNFKKRVEKEKSDIYAYANEKIAVELLNVIDNFERALDHASDGNESYAEGMSKIFKQLSGVLEKSGVKEIQSAGEPFDPNFHHAVMTESSSEYESGTVTSVLQKGYTLNGKVIRAAMVKVAE